MTRIAKLLFLENQATAQFTTGIWNIVMIGGKPGTNPIPCYGLACGLQEEEVMADYKSQPVDWDAIFLEPRKGKLSKNTVPAASSFGRETRPIPCFSSNEMR